MNVDDVGELFTTDGKDAWRMIYGCKAPTAMLQNLETGEEVGGALGCLNLAPFKRLLAEGDKDD